MSEHKNNSLNDFDAVDVFQNDHHFSKVLNQGKNLQHFIFPEAVYIRKDFREELISSIKEISAEIKNKNLNCSKIDVQGLFVSSYFIDMPHPKSKAKQNEIITKAFTDFPFETLYKDGIVDTLVNQGNMSENQKIPSFLHPEDYIDKILNIFSTRKEMTKLITNFFGTREEDRNGEGYQSITLFVFELKVNGGKLWQSFINRAAEIAFNEFYQSGKSAILEYVVKNIDVKNDSSYIKGKLYFTKDESLKILEIVSDKLYKSKNDYNTNRLKICSFILLLIKGHLVESKDVETTLYDFNLETRETPFELVCL